MKGLRRRIEVLERSRGDTDLTPEEQAAMAGTEPFWPHGCTAMMKLIRRIGGLEAVILRSYARDPAR
jgi:hypothetical protein